MQRWNGVARCLDQAEIGRRISNPAASATSDGHGLGSSRNNLKKYTVSLLVPKHLGFEEQRFDWEA